MIEYTVKTCSDGSKFWYLDGKLHREDGPAIEYPNGSKRWCLNGELHREDGPAVENSNGSKYWYLNGEAHREDGPAFEYLDGSKYWYLNGKELTEEDLNARRNSCNGKIVEIDGKRYKLVEEN